MGWADVPSRDDTAGAPDLGTVWRGIVWIKNVVGGLNGKLDTITAALGRLEADLDERKRQIRSEWEHEK